MIRICKFCKSEFEAKYKSDKRKYCSIECANKCPERRMNVSIGRKKLLKTKQGRDMYDKAMEKRNNLPYYQRRETKRTRERDIAHSRSEYKKWRISVLHRDKFTCRECGNSGILQAHHIKEWSKYPELRYDTDNGITLCPECHNKIHGFTILYKKKCPICNKKFKPNSMKQVCCSYKCSGKKRSIETRQNPKWTKVCKQCKKEFFGYSHRKFCSLDCYHDSLIKNK